MELLIITSILLFIAVLSILLALISNKKPAIEKPKRTSKQAVIKPVENEELFDHLFLTNYRELDIYRKSAA